MNKPKYNYDDVVSFELEHNGKIYLCTGKVYIVDKYGTVEQSEEPSYDIMVYNFLGGKEPCLVKHIRESSIEDKSMPKDFLEEHFVKSAEKCSSPEDILNWYRNLYYKEDKNTEHRIVAEAINEFFVKKLPELLKELKSEAIKEFAEKLKLHSCIMSDESQTGIINRYSVVTVNQIDNILKELVGNER